MEPEGRADVHPPMRRLNPTILALLAGVVVLLLLAAYFASSRNPDQDKLKDSQITSTQAAAPDKTCASQATYDLIKRDLFRRAAQLRGSDQAAYDRLATGNHGRRPGSERRCTHGPRGDSAFTASFASAAGTASSFAGATCGSPAELRLRGRSLAQ
jgi:hypothetical protein